MDKIRGFVLGFYSLLFQVILIREVLNILSGNEISIVTFFFIWLGAIFAGALIQNFISLSKKISNFLTLFNPLLLSLFSLFSIFYIREVRNFLNLSPGEIIPIGYFFMVCLGVFPLSFFIGFSFPSILKSDYGKISPSELYFFESMGSVFSCIIFTFLLAGRVYPVLIIVISIIFSLPLIFKKRRIVLFSLFFSLLFSSFVIYKGGDIQRYFDLIRWKGYKNGFNFVLSKDTKYQNLSIGKLNEEYGIFVNGSLFTTFPDPYSKKIRDYFFILQNLPQKILVIGGGYEEDLRYFFNFKGLKKLYYVQLDPDYISILKKIGVKVKNRKLKLFFEDGRKFLKENREKFDLIVLNVPPPSNLNENRFFTYEFFKLVNRSLSKDGIVVSSLPGKENYLGKEVGGFLTSFYLTLKKSFKNVIAISGEKIIFLSKNNSGKFKLNLETLVKDYNKLNYDKTFSPYSFTLLLQKERINWLNEILNNAKGEINRDFHPELFFKFLRVLNVKYGTSKFKKIDENTLKKALYFFYIILFLIIIFLFISIFSKKRRKFFFKLNSFVSMFLGGFAGMSILFLYIYLFQIIKGYIYSFIGFVFAIFMMGLTSGSILMKKNRWNTLKKHLLLSSLLFFIFGISELLMKTGIEKFSVIFFLTVVLISGFVTGGLFTISCEILSSLNVRKTKTAALIDSMDHLGGLSSTLFVGLLSINLMGLEKTVLILLILSTIFLTFSLLNVIGNRV